MIPRMNRRQFLFGSAVAAAGLALAACAKKPEVAVQPTVAPTAVPPTPAPTPTVAPKPTNTPIPTKPPATAVPTAVPAKEAPMLQELVKAGKLPPLQDRLPKNPLTLKPLHKIGKYGGTLRLFDDNFDRSVEQAQYGHSPLRWIDDGLNIAPGMCDTWETNADNSEWLLHIREGLKWSDGQPCTADDIMFAYEDLIMNPDFPDRPTEFYTPGPVKMLKVDDYTIKMVYPVPAPLTAKRLAMRVKADSVCRWIAPKHYCIQFHPLYNSAVKEYQTLNVKITWRTNPECPVLNAWRCESYEAGKRLVWVRNPYYYCVDTEGNQLPYIDRWDHACIENKEVQMLTILQGGVDYLASCHHKGGLEDIAPLKAGEKDGKYRLVLLDSGGGSGHYYYWNWDAPEENYRWLYRTPKFKMAFNYLRDRERITKTLYYGLGELTTGTMSPKAIEFNYNDEARAWYRKWRDCYIEYDPEKAKRLLDEIGIVDKDGDGWREFPDGKKLELRVDFNATASKTWMDGHEITIADFAKVGLKMITNQMPDAELNQFWPSGKGHIRGNWGVGDGPDCLVYPSWVVPNEPARWAPLCGNYYLARNTPKENSEKDVNPWDRQPPRWIADEKELIGEVVLKLQELLDTALAEPDAMKRMELVWQMIQIHIDQGTFGSGTTANTPTIFIYGNNLINAPAREELATGGFTGPWIVPHPAIHNPETFSFA